MDVPAESFVANLTKLPTPRYNGYPKIDPNLAMVPGKIGGLRDIVYPSPDPFIAVCGLIHPNGSNFPKTRNVTDFFLGHASYFYAFLKIKFEFGQNIFLLVFVPLKLSESF